MTTLTPAHRAALGLLNTIAYADGFSQAMFDWLHDEVRKRPLFADVPYPDYSTARGEVTKEWMKGPRDQVWNKWVRDLPSTWAIPTFELAVEAVLLDGHMADIERKGLIVMARALNISPTAVDAAVQRVVGRN